MRYVKNTNKKVVFLMTNMSIQPLWLTYFIEILLVLEFQLTKMYFGTFSYKAHFRPQISSNAQQQASAHTAADLPFQHNPSTHTAAEVIHAHSWDLTFLQKPLYNLLSSHYIIFVR